MSVFAAHTEPGAYAGAVEAYGQGGPLPVWTGDRADLLDGIALAEQVYTGRRSPAPADTGLLLDPELPEPLLALARPLARRWVRDAGELPGEGSVLLLGTYARLRGDTVQPLLDTAYAAGRAVFQLTGRDVHSLSWVVAKQYARVAADAEVGVVSELDTAAPAAGADVWCGAEDVRRLDVRDLALGRVWRRVLFHGNGKDDQLNLGQFTLCGASPVAATPGAPGPKCAYGLGCTKPMDKLIPAHGIRAAELVLANCFSGATAGHAMYDPKYLILLNALDGPAQTVLATLTACDGQRPENLVWLDGARGAGNTASAVNEALRDINPYPAFTQVGLESSGAPAAPAPGEEAASGEDGPDVHALGARLTGLLDSGLLEAGHPLRPRLRSLADTLLHDVVRTVALAPPQAAESRAAIARETTSLDLALAHRFAKHHDDPVLNFPTYFGERSVAGAPYDLDAPCACGRPLRAYRRRGRVPAITDTVQAVCARCGDVANSHDGAPLLEVEAADTVVAGEVLDVTVETVARRAGTINLGIVLPVYLDAKAGPVLRRVAAGGPGERVRTTFTLAVAPAATPQAYYFCPYAVQDLGISVSRVHVAVAPAAGAQATAPAAGTEFARA